MFPLLLSGWLGSVGLDAGSTHVALTRGARELIMPTQNPWVIDAVYSGAGVSTAYTLTRWHKTHPNWVKVYLISGIVLHSWATVHNVRVARRLR